LHEVTCAHLIVTLTYTPARPPEFGIFDVYSEEELYASFAAQAKLEAVRELRESNHERIVDMYPTRRLYDGTLLDEPAQRKAAQEVSTLTSY
jgi:hypothetical protein